MTAAYHSIVWAACDNDGHIIVADSNEGNIPSFVSESAEDAELLAQRLCGIHAVDRNRKPPIDYDLLADKGFYCFINDDPYDGAVYRLRTKPRNPICIDDLDDEIQRILSKQKLNVTAEKADCFTV